MHMSSLADAFDTSFGNEIGRRILGELTCQLRISSPGHWTLTVGKMRLHSENHVRERRRTLRKRIYVPFGGNQRTGQIVRP